MFVIIPIYNTTWEYYTPLGGIEVNFSVNATALGTISPLTARTDRYGNANVTFTSIKKSGIVAILSSIVSTGITASTFQNIDHSTPYRIAKVIAPGTAAIGSQINISVAFVDRYGNPIDNSHLIENVTYSIATSPKGNTTLGDSKLKTLNVSVGSVKADGYAYAEVTVNMDDYPGMTAILAYIPGVDDTTIWIEGTGSIPPYEIVVEPPPQETMMVPADGTSLATLIFRVYRMDGSPVANSNITIATMVRETPL